MGKKTPAPGWYETAPGQQQYWDGTTWHGVSEVPPPSPTTSPTSPKKQGFFAKQMSRKVGAIAAGSALLVGVGMGGAGGATNAEELTSLTSQVSTLEAQNAALQDRIDSLEEAMTAATEETDDASQRLKSALAEIDTRDKQLAERDAELAQKDARISELEAAAASSPQSSTESTTDSGTTARGFVQQPQTDANVYYKNCSAARAAGAAPVHRGDPGYGTHLDRDGDGVGCE